MAAPIHVKSQRLLLFAKIILVVKKHNKLYLGLVTSSSGRTSLIVNIFLFLRNVLAYKKRSKFGPKSFLGLAPSKRYYSSKQLFSFCKVVTFWCSKLACFALYHQSNFILFTYTFYEIHCFVNVHSFSPYHKMVQHLIMLVSFSSPFSCCRVATGFEPPTSGSRVDCSTTVLPLQANLV